MRRIRALGDVGALLALVVALAALGSAGARAAEPAEDLLVMELEELMDLRVTTASKRPTKVSETPAAVFVITGDDIRRSGATTIPEVLRLAPGVHVQQLDASRWAVSARGFNDEFANKLLVMIDGRSIYTPLFSGVIWNEHDLMLEDVERIEVVRGPGGTIWGANAVNGVIHIITRDARDTQGLLASALAGDPETFTGAARWGGSLGDDLHYRVYGKFADRDAFESSNGLNGHDAIESVRAGARADWRASEDTQVTVQGDFVDLDAGRMLITPTPGGGLDSDEDTTGGNVLARVSHAFSDTADLSLQVYYDRMERESLTLSEERDTVDVELQHAFRPFPRNRVVWGAGYRLSADRLVGSPVGTFDGRSQQDHLYSVFVQDEIDVVEGLLSLTAGSKLEHNDYTGFEVQPSARVLLTPHERHSLWASVSRAVRTPSRGEEDITFVQSFGAGSLALATGSTEYDAEKLLAYEAGYRTRPIDTLTLDVAGFYNRYDDYRSVDVVGAAFPFAAIVTFDNNLEGEGYGAEVAAQWAATDFLMLSGVYTFTRNDLSLTGAGNDRVSLANAENLTPRHRFRIGSRWTLPWDLELDASLGWVERLRGTAIDAYTRLDVRLAWRPVDDLELVVAGHNLIEEHQEFPATFLTVPSEVPRSVYGGVRWRFR